VNTKDQRLALIESLYRKGELRLDYYAERTLTASEAFEAKKGNCLSLVLLTAAMARQLGLPMHFQSVIGMTDWAQSDNFFMAIGHVNLVLEEIPREFELVSWSAYPVVVDFTPPDQESVLDVQTINENTVLAMYMNNRAVETLIQGNADDAYWWAKASILEDPSFINSYVTLGVIYRTRHHSEFAEDVLLNVSRYVPDNTTVMTNRILVLRDLGRDAEANSLAERLVKLDQNVPWGYYLQARAEYIAGRYENARHLYEKEIARDPNHHEFEFGLALVCSKMNDNEHAMKHLERAIELAQSRQTRAMYSARLDKLKATGSM
jgi:tetratricopeptide (TPR) repeat protein